MMKKLVIMLANNETEKAVLGEFGYFLGKWVYLMDAADDYHKDIKSNSFNPFVIELSRKNLTQKERSCYINGLLNETVSRITGAYNLMEIKSFKAILDNLVNMGLGQMQKKILFDKYEKDKNKKGAINP